jgi:thiamine monophosphate kinase
LPTSEECKTFAVCNNLDSTELTLYGGEEYELVLTVKPNRWKIAEKAVINAGGHLLGIGKVTSKKKVVLKEGAIQFPIEARGYEHFKT